MSIFRKIFIESPVWNGSVFFKEYAHNSGEINTKNKVGLPLYLMMEDREYTVSKENYLATLLLDRNLKFKYPDCGDPTLAFALKNLEITYNIHKGCVNCVANFPPFGECDQENILPLANGLKRLAVNLREAADQIENNSHKLTSNLKNC